MFIIKKIKKDKEKQKNNSNAKNNNNQKVKTEKNKNEKDLVNQNNETVKIMEINNTDENININDIQDNDNPKDKTKNKIENKTENKAEIKTENKTESESENKKPKYSFKRFVGLIIVQILIFMIFIASNLWILFAAIYRYRKINKKFTDLKKVNSDDFIKSFIKEFIEVCSKKNTLYYASIIVSSIGMLFHIVGIILLIIWLCCYES